MAVSEKEAVLRERAAFVAGATTALYGTVSYDNERRAMADFYYPLPKITRRRMVRDPHGLVLLGPGGWSAELHWTTMDQYLYETSPTWRARHVLAYVDHTPNPVLLLLEFATAIGADVDPYFLMEAEARYGVTQRQALGRWDEDEDA